MKANELRIGNKVSFEGSIVTVNTISDEEVTFSDYASFDYPQIEDISGIELTEEWLVRFGFKKGLIILNTAHRYLCFTAKVESKFYFYLGDDFGDNWCLNYIQYVHSLQNLYFALTGEELKQA
jgi:hypothetical protein